MSEETNRTIWDYMKYAGVVLLLQAFFFVVVSQPWWALGTFLAILVIDIVLATANKFSEKRIQTISQWVHALFPQAIDYAIMGVLVGFTWWMVGTAALMPVIMGIIIGHLFWREG